MAGLSLFAGDPIDRLLHKLGLASEGRLRFSRLAPLVVVLGWAVPLVLATLGGDLTNKYGRRGFASDFNLLIQTAVVIVLLYAQSYVDAHIRDAGCLFASSGIVDRAEYERGAAKTCRLRIAILPDVICGLVAIPLVYLWAAADLRKGIPSWQVHCLDGRGVPTIAQWWLVLIFGPLFEFLWLRWLWKISLWLWFLRRISRSKIRIAAGHPDRAGGLGFVGSVQASFGILIFAVGLLVLSDALKQIFVERLLSGNLFLEIVAFSILGPVAFLLPLLMFTRHLYAAKRLATVRWSSRITRILNATTHDRRSTDDETRLSEAVKRYRSVTQMRVVPFDMVSLWHLLAAAATPMLPLIVRGLDMPSWFQELVKSAK
ncbi:MAG: hypothetical protein ABI682_04000 [Acidobacteriota bacterium]